MSAAPPRAHATDNTLIQKCLVHGWLSSKTCILHGDTSCVQPKRNSNLEQKERSNMNDLLTTSTEKRKQSVLMATAQPAG
jgi:hypothetical protein